ncbi:uncharacterized protein LOC134856112, partial [Symsagittifera roscoffensis]|uniref:uncharacterized protein LOC134856112 n=1 Tax=Symsagittifera roscoffensis TaxID=84072 RepID=UPI00307B57D9
MMINTSMRQIISHTLFSSVFAVFVVNLVQSTELDCMNQLESSKGRCFLTLRNQQQCCHVFASEACREELSTPDDDAPPFVGFIPNSLAFDRDRNQLCLHGLDMRTGEKTSSLYGFQIYARKWHKDWTKEEVTSLNYMLPKSPRFPSVVPKDPKLNPLKDIIICFDLGTEIKSTIPDVYVTVELILLKPDKQATPVQHPDNPISLCTLDSLHLEKEGRCEVKRMELTPHTCEIKEETPTLLKQVGEVPPSMPPTTIQVARNTTESFRGTTSSPNEEVTFWTEDLSWPRWVVALIVILGGALIVILSSALFAAIFCACVRRNRRIKNNDADAWR